jgi:hypothetical protein
MVHHIIARAKILFLPAARKSSPRQRSILYGQQMNCTAAENYYIRINVHVPLVKPGDKRRNKCQPKAEGETGLLDLLKASL